MKFLRFKTFDLDGRSNSAKPAGLTFDGDVVSEPVRQDIQSALEGHLAEITANRVSAKVPDATPVA